jgi:hypothetical protein
MQFAFTLPADYETERIRARAARLGPAYDTLEHPGIKAVLMAEKGKDPLALNCGKIPSQQTTDAVGG